MKKLYVLLIAGLGLQALDVASSNGATTNEYYIDSETMDHYIITTIPAPSCSPTGSIPCRISTMSTPDSQNRVLKTEATVIAWQPD